ncbi:MAG: FAD-binding oxidoreductase [Actinomycetia bacterium]|nr:FAD-binding oxidoreductase [Actinomycetes bacterium]
MAAVDSVKLFADRFQGTALTPGEVGYDDARSLWNGDIDRHPLVIAQCVTDEHVVEALAFGVEQGIDISVRGGGHNFAGHGVTEGGVMIDLSDMHDVTVDTAARRVRCGGGTTWADLDAATQEHGLAVTGGVISHTGVAGLSLGGGIGWLTRKAGLSCDNLLSARVATVDGRVVNASADENNDLFWALRGGGGNFGVVTEFEFALHDVGPLVQLGLFFWGTEQGPDAFRFMRDYIAGLPDDTGVQIVGLNAPPLPFVPEQYHFAPGYILAVVGWGSPEEHAAVVQPIRDTLPPLFEMVTPIPYTDLQKMLDDAAPWGILAYEKALYLDDLTDDAIAVLSDHFPRKSSPMSIMPIFAMGGAYANPGEDDTAFGGSREAKWIVNISAIAPEAAVLDAERTWVRTFWDALRPEASGSGTYVNFLNDADEDRLRASYGAAKYDRLAQIKSKYDPDNRLHLNANINPAR